MFHSRIAQRHFRIPAVLTAFLFAFFFLFPAGAFAEGEEPEESVGQAPTSYEVTYELEHLTADGAAEAFEGQDFTVSLIPDEGYAAPEQVEVYVNGELLEEGAGYTYSAGWADYEDEDFDDEDEDPDDEDEDFDDEDEDSEDEDEDFDDEDEDSENEDEDFDDEDEDSGDEDEDFDDEDEDSEENVDDEDEDFDGEDDNSDDEDEDLDEEDESGDTADALADDSEDPDDEEEALDDEGEESDEAANTLAEEDEDEDEDEILDEEADESDDAAGTLAEEDEDEDETLDEDEESLDEDEDESEEDDEDVDDEDENAVDEEEDYDVDLSGTLTIDGDVITGPVLIRASADELDYYTSDAALDKGGMVPEGTPAPISAPEEDPSGGTENVKDYSPATGDPSGKDVLLAFAAAALSAAILAGFRKRHITFR